MDIINTFGIAVGLAMDAFAVSIAAGAVICVIRFRYAFKIGITFGLFQFIMPILGWFLALQIKQLIGQFDHWIAFVLLLIVGGRMIYESFRIDERKSRFVLLSVGWLIAMGLATSIDALIIGVTFALLGSLIILPSIVIGIVAFSFSFIGFVLGCRIGHLFENKVEIAGGIILIGIGLKILIQHLFF